MEADFLGSALPIHLFKICAQQIINNLFCPDFSFGAR
jgi:hypothetical protein